MIKMVNKCKIILILIILLFCLSLNYSSYAGDSTVIDFGMADSFIEAGKDSTAGGLSDLTDIGKSFSTIGNILTFIGAGILVAATGYMGILYLISPPEKQAKLKEQSIGLVVSAVVIFGAYYIWEIIVTFLTGVIG